MKNILFFLFPLIFMLGCGGGEAMTERTELPSMAGIPDATWQTLAQKKIYFGHQSVGDNIIAGMNELMQSHPAIKLKVLETHSPAAFGQPVFAHSEVGKNSDTDSKINAFREYMQKGIGNKADIAFFKFCFWDIRSHTDAGAVFESYKAALAALKKQYPKTKFVHFTVPLMDYPNGIKDKVLRVFQMKNQADLDNIRRNELNDLILTEYRGKEPVFDIAMVESTLPDGRRTGFSREGKTYFTLASEYTDDGGHLAGEGRRHVAEQLLIFLAKLSAEK